jgi:lysophospholipase L1-like esterase
VLHFGCSSAAAIAPELERQLGARGIRVVSYTKEGTHLPLWGGRYSNVPHLMRKHDPDLVLINLGGNDAIIEDPSDRVESIQRLVSYVRHKPCVWIGPSMWTRDNGVLAMIRDHAGPCRYFDTDAIVPGLPRDRRDPIHPSLGARKTWTEAIVAWLERERDEQGPLPFSLRPTSGPP